MVDIVQVLRLHGIDLKKSGRGEFKACCPFHNEKTPSFFVSQEKQLYHCFGCREHGTVISFLMNYDKYSYVDAIEYLADMVGLPVERENSGSSQDDSVNYGEFYGKMNECANLYMKALKEPSIPQGINYFLNRGISLETIDRFKLGYAPPGWNFLTKYLVKDQNRDLKLLEELGLIKRSEKSGGFYDIFRDRVMIPILDRRGRVVAFGGRVLNDDKPKYLNSPEMAIFHKGRELFGLYQAIECSKQNQGNIPYLVIVEGYMDVIALAQSGFDYAVASLGTSTTEDQFSMMFHYTKQVICCYDGDAAGQRAAWHALQVILPIIRDDCEVRFSFLPVEHDPDTFVREYGAAGFQQYLEKSEPLITYFFKKLKADLSSGNSNRELINNALEILATMPNNLRFDELLNELAKSTYQDVAALQKKCEDRRCLSNNKYAQQKQKSAEPELELTPIRRVYALSIQYPKSVISGQETIIKLLKILKGLSSEVKGIIEYEQMFNFIIGYPSSNEISINTACILNACKNTKFEKWVFKLANTDIYGHAGNIKTENIAADITATLSKLILERYEYKVAFLQNESMKRNLTDEELNELSSKIRFIKKYSGRTITSEQ